MMPRRPTKGESRVVEAHRLVRRAFAIAAGFGVTAAAWAVVVFIRGGSWWGPLHAFLAGAVLAAISGASQMFTITWSSAPAPPRRASLVQGSGLAAGVALVLVGVPNGWDLATWIGGAFVVGALALLGTNLVGIIRRSLLRRFDLSIRFYLLALACGVAGVTIGALLGTHTLTGDTYASARIVHLHLNLVGLVGLTIIGTIPTLLPTFAHTKTVSGREAVLGWRVSIVAVLLIAAGLVGPTWLVGVGSTLIGAVAIVITLGIAVRLGRRAPDEILPYLQVLCGLGWLAAWTIVDGAGVISGVPLPAFSGWTAAAVVSGVGQVLVGSIAYLLPVAVGAPITDNLHRMGRRAWAPLVALNALGFCLVVGIPVGAAVAGGVWLADFTVRLARVRRPAPRQTQS